LTKGARSLLLTTSDAQTWIVDALDVDQTLVGKNVIVDGISTAADRIKADWIGGA
jgi:fructose-specific component phosphotransferase system IIB-like protein